MSEKLLPCPFCGHENPEFERMGDRRQSCIVICGWCGARHESSDEGECCGSSWNQRAEPGQDGLRTTLETALNRIEDMLAGDDGQAFKEARKFLDANRPLSTTTSAPTAVEPDERADMFWDHGDPERFGHDIDEIVQDYGPGEIVKIDQAKRLPTITVRVLPPKDEDSNLEYEVIDDHAASASKGTP